eukprot:scaffold1781_cov416-Prasinococcus_capsulatus_cf.AAC.16
MGGAVPLLPSLPLSHISLCDEGELLRTQPHSPLRRKRDPPSKPSALAASTKVSGRSEYTQDDSEARSSATCSAPSKLALVPLIAAGPKQRAGFIAAPEYPVEMRVPLLKMPILIAVPMNSGANTGPKI